MFIYMAYVFCIVDISNMDYMIMWIVWGMLCGLCGLFGVCSGVMACHALSSVLLGHFDVFG